MADAIPLPFPWFKPKQAATSTETTSGKDEATRWQIVATNLTPTEAILIKGRLESHDIPALIQQEAVGSLLGLTTGPLGWAAVAVPEEQVEPALAILAEVYEVEADPDSTEADLE